MPRLRYVTASSTTTRGSLDRLLAWGLLFFLAVAAWRWGGLKSADGFRYAAGALLLLGLAFLGAYRQGGDTGWWRRDAFFWTGLLFLLYLGLQWWNAGRILQWDAEGGTWSYTPPRHPRAPWAVNRRDAAQMLQWFFPAWALGAIVRSPLMSRRTLEWLFRGLLYSAGALAAAGAFSFLSASGRRLWTMPEGAESFASFGYANHGAAYFTLLGAVAAGFLFREVFRRDRPAKKALLIRLAAGMLLCLLGANLSLSRMGVILSWIMALFASVYGLWRGWRILRPAARLYLAAATFAVAILFCLIVVGTGGEAIRGEFAVKRRPAHQLVPFVQRVNLDLSDRPQLWRLAWSLFREEPLYGVGGWGFRYLAPFHLPQDQWRRWRDGPGRANVHCDPLQFLVEFGAAGAGLMTLGMATLAGSLFRRDLNRGSVFVMTCAGLAAVLVFAFIDLPFRCPAVLWTWTALLAALPALTARAQLERPARYRPAGQTAVERNPEGVEST